MRGDVRLYPGVPPVSAFGSAFSSPIVIDSTTGVAYFLNGNTVQPLAPDSSSVFGGTYTATGIAILNCSGVTFDNPTHWCRIGKLVQVWGRVDFSVTAAAAATGCSVDLPISKTISSTTDIHGVMGCSTKAVGGGVAGYTTTNAAQLTVIMPSTGGAPCWFNFAYLLP